MICIFAQWFETICRQVKLNKLFLAATWHLSPYSPFEIFGKLYLSENENVHLIITSDLNWYLPIATTHEYTDEIDTEDQFISRLRNNQNWRH